MNKIASILQSLEIDDQDVISNCAARAAQYLIENNLVAGFTAPPGFDEPEHIGVFAMEMEDLLGRDPRWAEVRMLDRCVRVYLKDRELLQKHLAPRAA